MKTWHIVLIVIGVIILVIGLILGSIALTWFKVRDTIEEGNQEVNSKANCIGLNFEVLSSSCNDVGDNRYCDISVQRKGGGVDISGIRFAILNTQTGNRKTFDKSINLAQFTTTDIRIDYTSEELTNPNRVIVAPYLGSEGQKIICDPVAEEEITN